MTLRGGILCVCVGIGDPKLARAEVPLGMGPYSSKLLANKLIGQERERDIPHPSPYHFSFLAKSHTHTYIDI